MGGVSGCVVLGVQILRQGLTAHVTPADLRPVLAGILVSHPGLEFLQDSPEFQDRCVCVCVCVFWGGEGEEGDGSRLTS
jgi:hypothetical protein